MALPPLSRDPTHFRFFHFGPEYQTEVWKNRVFQVGILFTVTVLPLLATFHVISLCASLVKRGIVYLITAAIEKNSTLNTEPLFSRWKLLSPLTLYVRYTRVNKSS